MDKYMKATLVLPVVIAAVPMVASAEEVQYVQWNEVGDTYHLYDDERTITFSHAVDSTSLDHITVFDETAQKDVATVAEIGATDHQIVIKLAKGIEYENNHSYTLTIKGVKQKDANTVIAPTKYAFKMIYKTPEEVSFASSYIVTNTSNDYKSFKVPAGATYITYDEYGTTDYSNYEGVQVAREQYVSLGKNDRMTVSFMTKTELATQEGFKVEESKDASHTIYKLYERNNIKITGQDRQSQTQVFFGNNAEKVYASHANYGSDLEAGVFEYRVEANKAFKNKLLNKLDNMVVTNEDDGILYVYAPKTTYGLTEVEAVEEKAVVALTLEESEKLVATSTEPNSLTDLDYSAPQGDWKISHATYAKDDVDRVGYNAKESALITVGYDAIIKNEASQPLTVSGPARYVSLEKTEEEPLVFYELNKGDKVKVTTNLKEHHDVGMREPSNKGTYSYLRYYGDEVNSVAFNDAVYEYGDNNFTVSENFSNLIENVGTPSLLLYGPARAVTFEKYSEEIFTKLELAPGEKVQVKANKETGLYLKDPTRKGSYNITTNANTKEITFSYVTQSHTMKNGDSEIIENTGRTPITVFGAKEEISLVK